MVSSGFRKVWKSSMVGSSIGSICLRLKLSIIVALNINVVGNYFKV